MMRKWSNQAASEGEAPRTLFGLQISAIVETIVFLSVVTALGAILDVPNRFSEVALHPFWIAVILISCVYGIGEGLVAAALATCVLLVGNVPEQGFDEERSEWLLRTATLPVAWFLTAALLGEIRSGHIRTHEALLERFADLHAKANRIVVAYKKLAQAKSNLEQRVATQKQTLTSIYEASSALERLSVSEVLGGAPAFVRAIMGPKKFSVFILRGGRLEALTCENWTPEDGFASEFQGTSSLFEAIVIRNNELSVANPADEITLSAQGLLAGPLRDPESGHVFGMLKIEEIGASGLTPSSAIEFHTVCAWIGRACGRASRLEARMDVTLVSGAVNQARATDYPTTHEGVDSWDYAIFLSGATSPVAEAIGRRLAQGPDERTAPNDRDGSGRAVKVVRLQHPAEAGHAVN